MNWWHVVIVVVLLPVLAVIFCIRGRDADRCDACDALIVPDPAGGHYCEECGKRFDEEERCS